MNEYLNYGIVARMAMSEAARADLCNGLSDLLGPERAETLMTHLPRYDAGQGPDPEAWEYIFVGIEPLAGDLEFVDVPDSHFASRSVEWMYDKDHTRGCREYIFCPDDLATRGKVAVFMKRVLEPYLGPTEARDFIDSQGH